jgi:hypothetical protein
MLAIIFLQTLMDFRIYIMFFKLTKLIYIDILLLITKVRQAIIISNFVNTCTIKI